MSKRKKNRYAIQPAESSPKSLPMPSRYSTGEYRLVQVFVEGYDDVAFWRGIFDDYETEWLKFEISVPPRQDLAKGKKVLLGMIGECCDDRILCVDSDFDYLFEDFNEQSRQVNRTPYLFHTYAYATENYLCWPASLHKVCVKATKNDTMIFDFERFMGRYSRSIRCSCGMPTPPAAKARKRSRWSISAAASGSTTSTSAKTGSRLSNGSSGRSPSASGCSRRTTRNGPPRWKRSDSTSATGESSRTTCICSCKGTR